VGGRGSNLRVLLCCTSNLLRLVLRTAAHTRNGAGLGTAPTPAVALLPSRLLVARPSPPHPSAAALRLLLRLPVLPAALGGDGGVRGGATADAMLAAELLAARRRRGRRRRNRGFGRGQRGEVAVEQAPARCKRAKVLCEPGFGRAGKAAAVAVEQTPA
jgi:hypothetical protein